MRLNKKMITSLLLVGSLLLPTSVFASNSITGMFGEDPQRDHYNVLNDPNAWMQVAVVKNGVTTDGTTDSSGNPIQFNIGGGDGTAVAQGNILVFPVSAPNNDPSQYGYLTAYDFSKTWTGNPAAPEEIWGYRIKGVSNSTPVIHNNGSTTNVYLAAGNTLYGFNALTGTPLAYFSGNLSVPSGSPVYREQIVSHPLYVTQAEQSTASVPAPSDLIWVSSQDGYLYAIDPNTLITVYSISIGSRLDASPSLIKDANGNPYIAVATAYSPNNTGGTGTMYIIDPRTGNILTYISNPSGSPVLTAAVSTGTGYMMWNNYEGDVFFYSFNADHSFSKLGEWDKVGGDGVTTNQEAGYSTKVGYVLPFSSSPQVVLVNPNTNGSPISIPIQGKAVSSPLISNDNIYVGDDAGYIDQFLNVSGITEEIAPYIGATSGSVNGTQNLASVMEENLPFALNRSLSVPTMAFVGGDGLYIWQNVGGNYTFTYDGNTNESFTPSQKATFSGPLDLTTSINMNILPSPSDQLDITYSVDGGAAQPLTSVDVFDTGGVMKKKINIDMNKLNGIAPTWNDNNMHKIKFTVQQHSNNVFNYRFNSTESGNSKPTADVTVTFSPAGTSVSTGGSGSLNLSIKYNPFNTPIPIGTATIPVTVSNDGKTDVTTQVVMVRNGYKPVPVYGTQYTYDDKGNITGSYSYLDHYNNVPDTQTVTQTVTIPARSAKPLTFSVWTGERILGSYSTGFSDDPNYSFQVVSTVNPNHNPSETDYSDNVVSLWVKTQGQALKPPTVHITD